MAISSAEVEKTKQDIEAAQRELPEAGQFNASVASLRDTLLILKDVWNTQGGANEIGKLNSCIEELEGYSSYIEEELEAVKSATVNAFTSHHKELIATESIKDHTYKM